LRCFLVKLWMAVKPSADYSTELLYCTFYLVFKEPSAPRPLAPHAALPSSGEPYEITNFFQACQALPCAFSGRLPLEFERFGLPGLEEVVTPVPRVTRSEQPL
jgi:hypothetical protein